MISLRQVSWCVTVVVVSDDPAFLAAFAEWSLKGRLLVWSTGSSSCSLYIHLPYSQQGTQALRLASWTPTRPHSHFPPPLFPNKFSKFEHGASLVVVAESASRSAHRIRAVRPPNLLQGTHGQPSPPAGQEADIGLGPFGMSAIRAEVVDYKTYTDRLPQDHGRSRATGVDPWGFCFRWLRLCGRPSCLTAGGTWHCVAVY
ncbi:putative olfactory ionotropic receptor IR4-like 9 [Homarus americanus]|uniref:Putative olfactory ionotropic receptor IR4-like 9 n=1 Tax=Homarus americanus TaxID=6706 RepID=A0A8J5JQR4_HOMAM|nr:putative olfactory ionotropic receptor IR4-like 9 [Homarus americanus]